MGVDQEALNTVFEAVSFASQALSQLPSKLQQVLDHQNDNAKAWQRQAAHVVQACEKRLESLGQVVGNEMQQALENVKYREELLIQVQDEMRNSISRIQSYKHLEDELRLEIHKKEQDGKTLEKELAFQQVDKQRLSDTLKSREKETIELRARLDEVEDRCRYLEDQHSRSKKARLAEVHKIKTSWEAEVKEKDEEIGQLYDQCSEVNKDLTDMNGKMKQMSLVSKTLKEKLVAAQEENGKVLEDQKTSHALAESQKQTIEKLEKEVEELRSEVEMKRAAEAELQETVKSLEVEKRMSETQLGELTSSKEEFDKEMENQTRIVVQQELEIKKLKEELEESKENERLQASRLDAKVQEAARQAVVAKAEEGEAAKVAEEEKLIQQKEREERQRRERERPQGGVSPKAATFSLDAMMKGKITNEMSRQREVSQQIRKSDIQTEEKIKKTETDLKLYYHFMDNEGKEDSDEDPGSAAVNLNSTKRKPPQQPPPPPPRSLLQRPSQSPRASPLPTGSSTVGSAPNTLQKQWNSISKSRIEVPNMEDSSSGEEDNSSMDESDKESESVTKKAEEVISNSKDVYQKLKELKESRQKSLSRAKNSLRRLSVKPVSPIMSPGR
ncbi:hypothetical protein HOP50_07g48290 [Chloropicon primus]|uniref:Uncharacterized protein n=1 Tax=Chloropicon primus TaxID=1764295 RepID=A0A5B8MPN3_9CHLO|nr:hypothetical protein A3770_07p48090 [Chloropicon primus]UPR01507.1 hypothetical protein HOP50_07g48290 [Chloropicon primus]|eukprot:QDZ22291.1 hypothetical protein A3770_07p48090 [Chloropicon primus]